MELYLFLYIILTFAFNSTYISNSYLDIKSQSYIFSKIAHNSIIILHDFYMLLFIYLC